MFTARRLDILADSSLKIYHYRARAYDPDTGRFLQTDPIGYADSMNLYEYVTGNPANWVDPWGLVSRGELLESVQAANSGYVAVLRELAAIGLMARNGRASDSQMSAKLEQITQLYNQYRGLRNETISLTGQFADEQWWISRKDMQAINSAYGLARDGELASYLSVDMDILLEEMEICCNVCDSTGRLAGRTQAVYTTFKTAETVCTVASAAGGVAVIGKEAAKLGLKRGAVYVAKQAAAIAATQAGMTVVVHPLAQKYGISETQLRVGLAAVQALTMYKAFTRPGAKTQCIDTSQAKGVNRPKVRKAVIRGNNAHRKFAEKVKKKPGWQSQPRIKGAKGDINIPDATDPKGRPVELKPNTPSGRRSGARQIKRYKRVTGKNGRVIYYEP